MAKTELLIIFVYHTIKELTTDVKDYINFYNHKRFHQTLGYKKPISFYYDSLKINNKDYDKLVEIGA
jgi:putative transposase